MSPFGEPSSPASYVSLFLSHARTDSGDPFHSSIDLEFIGRRSITHWFTDHFSRVGVQRGLDFHSPLKTLFKIRFSVYSKPWTELRLQNRGGVGPAHYSEVV